MPKKNRICKACGESYSYCPNCSGATAAEKYRIMFCSKNCRDVFQACVRYNMKHTTKEEAKAELLKLDLSKRNHFSDQIKSDIDEIMYVEVAQTELRSTPSISIQNQDISTQQSFETFTKKSKYSKRQFVENDIKED